MIDIREGNHNSKTDSRAALLKLKLQITPSWSCCRRRAYFDLGALDGVNASVVRSHSQAAAPCGPFFRLLAFFY